MFDLGFEFDSSPTFLPYKIDKIGMVELFKDIPEDIKVHARKLRDEKGIQFYAVDQDAGFCSMKRKIITIPSWVIFKKPLDYRIWYISHEISHGIDNCKHGHGLEFMEILKRICPKESIHYELTYKPRNAAKAGIQFQP